MEAQRQLCEELDMTGRTIIAKEGINATLEATDENMQTYIKTMQQDDRFADIDFKISPGTGRAFPKLSIKVRDEIVASRLPEDIDPTEDTGTYLDPETLHEWYETNEDFVVIDMRNDYEYKSGHFEDSVNMQMEVFRELPEKVKNIENLKDKKVVPVCTGGIRCEKASAYLKEQGFENVYQLKGGMHRYMEQYPTGHFKGALYVFDGRMTVAMAEEDKRGVVGECEFCGTDTEQYVDDDSITPSRQLLCCDDCYQPRSEHLRIAKTARQ